MNHHQNIVRQSWASLAIVLLIVLSALAQEEGPAVLKQTMKSLAGDEVNLADKYAGKVVMVVNVASRCGLTRQYKQLQQLHEKYGEKGLAILGFPCNQFGRQEPGSSEDIREFCTANYGVSFDMFEKIKVNGDDACPLYKSLTALELQPAGSGDIGWNFEKFLFDKSGKPVARFSPRTSPDADEVVAKIEASLAE